MVFDGTASFTPPRFVMEAYKQHGEQSFSDRLLKSERSRTYKLIRQLKCTMKGKADPSKYSFSALCVCTQQRLLTIRRSSYIAVKTSWYLILHHWDKLGYLRVHPIYIWLVAWLSTQVVKFMWIAHWFRWRWCVLFIQIHLRLRNYIARFSQEVFLACL